METRAAHVEVLEPLRGFAALAVAYFHFTNSGGLLPSGWLKTSGAYGWLGVEVFFVISGFIIPFSLHQARYRFSSHLTRFLLKRVVRLDPPYVVAIALTVVLGYVSAAIPGFRGSPPSVDPIQLLLHFGYLNAFFGYPWIIPVLWTLAIEFQFYFLIAVIFPLIAHTSTRIRLGALSVMCGLAFVIPDRALVFHYLGLFVLGMLTFTKYVELTPVRSYLLLLIPFSVATAMSLNMLTAVVGLLTALLIAFAHIPRFAPFAFLGAISYSMYLLHAPIGGRVVNFGARFAHNAIAQIAVLALAIGISIVAAYLLYRFVERPARKWSSSLRYQEPPLRSRIGI
jgi:peptidoglycan/LPS O-acetylase OafA/YrhL